MISNVVNRSVCHTETCGRDPDGSDGFCLDCEARIGRLIHGIGERFWDLCVDATPEEQDELQKFVLLSMANMIYTLSVTRAMAARKEGGKEW